MARYCHPRATTRPAPGRPKDRTPDVDIVIAGASFAGLAVARTLRGHNTVVLEPQPIGAHDTSAGGVPLSALQALDASDAARETHHQLIVHTPRAEHDLALVAPYAVADYELLCRRLAEQAQVHVLHRRVTGYRDGAVRTDRGDLTCLAAVDATGHRAVLASSLTPGYAPRSAMGTAAEVVLRRPRSFPSGLHIYLGPDWPPGYGWAFGAGDTLRVGVGLLSATRHARHLDAALHAVLARAGLSRAGEPLGRHGGLIPLRPRDPIVDDLFVVGDAAGQALPGTAEGIRPALHFGTHLGAALADALDGRTSLADARRSYREGVAGQARAYRTLACAQRLLTALPPAMTARLVAAVAASGVTAASLRRYQRALALPTEPRRPRTDGALARAAPTPTRDEDARHGATHFSHPGAVADRPVGNERSRRP